MGCSNTTLITSTPNPVTNDMVVCGKVVKGDSIEGLSYLLRDSANGIDEKNTIEETGRLLDAGADVNNGNGAFGYTALMYAASYGEKERMELMFKKAKKKVDVNIRNLNGDIALHLAAKAGKNDVKVVEMLIAHNADVNCKNGKGKTALHKAAEYCRLAVIELLLKHNIDRSATDNDGKTALDFAKGTNSVYTKKIVAILEA